jgi:hypothetical protein
MSSTVIKLSLGLVVLLAACTRPSEVYEIPAGYTGWVEIRYSKHCNDTVRTSYTKRIFHVPSSGRMCVRATWLEGYGRDSFFYVYPDGRRVELHEETPVTGMIWGRHTEQVDMGEDRTVSFYVGSERAFRGGAN